MRLWDHLPDAVSFLDKDVAKRRKDLMKTLEWDLKELPDPAEHEVFVR